MAFAATAVILPSLLIHHRVAPVIKKITPNPVHVGQSITIVGYHFAATDTVLFGGVSAGVYPSHDGKTISLTVPSSVENKPVCLAGQPCPEWVGAIVPIRPGINEITVRNNVTNSKAYALRIASSTSLLPL